MLYEATIYLLKVGGGVLLLLILRALWLHWNVLSKLKRFQAMGIPTYPGCEKFLVGPIIDIQTEFEKRK